MSERCDNCDATLVGGYCAECGQSAADFDLPITDFAKHFASEALSLDGRLRLTLWPLFSRPGAVAKEYVAGRRARFVPPIRLYIFASFTMFLLLALGPGVDVQRTTTDDGTVVADSLPPDSDTPAADGLEAPADAPDSSGASVDLDLGGGSLEASFEERLSRGLERISEDRDAFTADFMANQARAVFFLLPAFALLLKIVYRRRLYVHHVVFAVYLHSLVFLLVGLVALPEILGLETIAAWLELLLLGVPIYLALAMKHFYEESWPRTLFKFGFVSLAYGLIGGLTLLAVLIVSVLNV